MLTTPFNAASKTFAAAVLSLTALLAMGFYLFGSAPDATFAAKLQDSAQPSIRGVIKASRKNVRGFRVWVSLRRGGQVVKRAMVPVRRDGSFAKRLPRGTDRLLIVVREPGPSGRVTRGAFSVRPGKTVVVTAGFPSRGGLIPSLFPY